MAYVGAALAQQKQGTPYRPKYFQPDEWRQITIIVDIIIPKDEKSGSATDAGVPHYMDFFCTEYANNYSWMRDALRYFDGFAYQMGVKDIGYIGNVAVPSWNGCPPAALTHLGVQG